MKKLMCAIFMLSLTVVMADAKYVVVESENPAKPDLTRYDTIYISKLGMPANLWRNFGYESQDKWLVVVNDIDTVSLKTHLAEKAPSKKIVASVKAPTGAPGVFVKLAYKGFRQNTGRAYAHNVDTLDVVVTMYDNKTGKQLYTANVGSQSTGTFSRGWMMNTLEGRLDNQVYNLCCFIAGKF